MTPEAQKLLEQIDVWDNLSGSEQAFLCRSVKDCLPRLRETLRGQADEIDKLTRDLKARTAEAAEYKTRAESQDKVNKQLAESHRECMAEIAQLKERIRQAASLLSEA